MFATSIGRAQRLNCHPFVSKTQCRHNLIHVHPAVKRAVQEIRSIPRFDSHHEIPGKGLHRLIDSLDRFAHQRNNGTSGE